MLTKQELKELASLQLKERLFVSLYLDVDPKSNPKKDWLRHFKSMTKTALAKLTPNDRKAIQHDIDKIEAYLTDRPSGMKRGLAIICSTQANQWRVYNTAIPFHNELIVDHDPYIKPLAQFVHLYKRYLIAVVDNDKVRLLITALGEINELTTIEKPEIEFDSTRDGMRGDLEEVRLQKHKDKVRRLLAKEATAVLENIIKSEDINQILIGGTDANRGNFKEALSPQHKAMVAGDFALEHDAGPADILLRVLPLLKEIERANDQRAIDELFNRSGSTSGIVVGLSDVLTALQQGNIHKLYAVAEEKASGMHCAQCGALTPLRESTCPYCGAEMTQVPYMIDLAVQKAIELGAHIGLLDYAPELHKAGGIGAVLRY